MRKVSYLLLGLIFFMGVIVNAQPAPPTNLTASITEVGMHRTKVVKLQWTAPSTYLKYNIFKKVGAVSDTGTFVKKFSGFRGTSFYDYSPMLEGQVYSYYVTAVNTTGESEPSNIVEISLTPVVTETGIVKGIVKDEAGLPIKFAKVSFHGTNTFHGLVATTDSLGKFSKTLPVGSYFMRTGAMGYIPEYYDNVPSIDLATPIVVALNATQEFEIILGAYVPPVTFTVTGSVKDSLDNPLAAMVKGLRIRANTFHRFGMFAYTDELGNYTLTAREGDTLVVYAHALNRNFFPEFYDNKPTYNDADRIVVNGNMTNVNFVLSHKPVYQNGITGTIKNSDNVGVESVVNAYLRTNVSNVHRRYTIYSDSLGNYSFNNLVPGQYILLAVPTEGYKPTFFQYSGVITLNWREADSVAVSTDQVVTGINFVVEPMETEGIASVVGHVLDNTQKGLNGALVYVKDINEQFVSYAFTDVNGQFEVRGLQPGSYQVFSNEIDFTPANIQTVTLDYYNKYNQSVYMTLTPNTPTGVKDDNTFAVTSFTLGQNYPNPFNPTTSISYTIPYKANVKLSLYNVLGKEVMVMVNETKEAGEYSYKLNASSFPSGVYFYRIDAGNFTATKKLTLIK